VSTLGDVVDIAAAGLVAQRARMTATASNLANAQTTRTPEGGPYRRRDPVFEARPVGGPFAGELERQMRKVEVSAVREDPRPPVMRHQPGHPDADANGMVAYPRVDPVEEMGNMLSANRSFEANVAIMRKARAMGEAVLAIGR